MHLLLDPLPTTLNINNEIYPIDYDFKTMILFEELMLDDEISTSVKLDHATKLFYLKDIPGNLVIKSINEMLWFWAMGKENKDKSTNKSSGKEQAVFSFKYDAEYIYSAFLAQYNIDIIDTDMHWWKFISLFKGLDDTHMLSKIINYRSVRIDNNMSKEDKEFYREMKRLYKLPDTRTQEEKDAEIANLFV